MKGLWPHSTRSAQRYRQDRHRGFRARPRAIWGRTHLHRRNVRDVLRKRGVPVREVAEVTGFPGDAGRPRENHPSHASPAASSRCAPSRITCERIDEHEIPPHRHGGGESLRSSRRSPRSRRQRGRTDREHRHRRTDDDPRGGEELSGCGRRGFARGLSGRPQELHAPAATLARNTHWELAKKAFATDRRVRSRHQHAPGAIVSSTGLRDATLGRAAILDIHARGRCRSATARIRTSMPRCIRSSRGGIAGAEQLHGKELSYNNLVDLDAAWQLIQEFDEPGLGGDQTHQSVRLRRARDARGKLPARVRSRSGVRFRRRAGVQSRTG